MTEENATQANEKLLALQSFLLDNPDLAALERQLAPFNLFEALGAVRDELRHSDFLAFLLNPAQNHGLRDRFVKGFLQIALAAAEPGQTDVRPIDVALWDLDGLDVRREWQNIDLLLVDETNHLTVIIENKVYSGEHSGQLERYWNIAEREFPGHRIAGIFLTPDGIPAKESERYIRLSYLNVCEVLESLLGDETHTIHPEVRAAIAHYTRMLRRHIVSESEIADLCRKIYRKHQKALDLIFEYRLDHQSLLRDHLIDLIQAGPGLIYDGSIKSEVRFTPCEWDVPLFHTEGGWGHLLTFYIQNLTDRVRIMGTIAPGPMELRQKLLDMALKPSPPFKSPNLRLYPQWNNVYSKVLLTAKDLTECEDEQLRKKLQHEWDAFLRTDLQAMLKVVREQPFWKDAGSAL